MSPQLFEMVEILDHLSSAEDMLNARGNADSLEEDLGLALLAAIDYRRARVFKREAGEGFSAYRRFVRTKHTVRPSLQNMVESASLEERMAAEFGRGMQAACLNRYCVRTSSGHEDLAPKTTTIGNTVAVLYGLNVPAILRSPDSTTGYELVGQAYLQGILDGEAVSAHTAEGREDDMFRLI